MQTDSMALKFALAAIIASTSAGVATAAGQHYKPHDPVHIVANKVGPFNNPSETYEVRACPVFIQSCLVEHGTRCRGSALPPGLTLLSVSNGFSPQYYTLPFCRTAGKQKRHHHELGEYLVGDRKVTAPYQVCMRPGYLSDQN